MKRIVSTDKAPRPVGPYSQAVVAGNLVFCSGQIALDPETGEIAGSDAASQTERVLKNLQAVLEAAGTSLAKVVKTTIYLRDLGQFQEVNEVYARFFEKNPPARSTLQASDLPKGALVEIEAVALLD